MSHWQTETVAVVGCGGLGVPAAWTLAHAGARRLRLIDGDEVELSNLHRQVLYQAADCGQPKTARLAAALQRRFDGLQITCVDQRVTPDNASTLLADCAAVVEGSDDAVAKFAINDWAIDPDPDGHRRRSAVIAAAIGRRGQWMLVQPGGACYRCLFEEPPPAEMLATCAIAGVMGPVVGLVGAMAARSLVQTLEGHGDCAASARVRWLPGMVRRTPVQPAVDCSCARQAREVA